MMMAVGSSVAYLAGIAAALGIDPRGTQTPASPYVIALLPTVVVAVILVMDARLRRTRGMIARTVDGVLRLASTFADRGEWYLRIAVATGAVVIVQVGCELASLH
jgi:hypothetical protein